MSLGAPGQIIAITGNVATVDFWGTPRTVNLEILEEPVAAGDYIVEHQGYAIRRIRPEDVVDTIAMYEIVLAEDVELV
jgi:hydrogenase expression/formation protein HypC